MDRTFQGRGSSWMWMHKIVPSLTRKSKINKAWKVVCLIKSCGKAGLSWEIPVELVFLYRMYFISFGTPLVTGCCHAKWSYRAYCECNHVAAWVITRRSAISGAGGHICARGWKCSRTLTSEWHEPNSSRSILCKSVKGHKCCSSMLALNDASLSWQSKRICMT